MKLRKAEDGLPKSMLREIESLRCIAPNQYIMGIQEVYLGRTSFNIVYDEYCDQGDLCQYIQRARPFSFQQVL